MLFVYSILFLGICKLGLINSYTTANNDDDFILKVIEAQVSNALGSGMDGGKGGILPFGGGQFKIRICQHDDGNCCETSKKLNTEEDNWEVGEVNYFVGYQIHECESLKISGEISLTLHHEGPDGGLLDYINLYDSHLFYNDVYYNCPIGVKLDESESRTFKCQLIQTKSDLSKGCNGDPKFCEIPFNRFTFPGMHNAGTGQREKNTIFNCGFRNQDLNVIEQLNFGIRFFDLDVIYSEKLAFCNGLETGHGSNPEYGLFQCFGSMENYFNDIKEWINENPRDVIILYFGSIDFEDTTLPLLKKMILQIFPNELNTNYKFNGKWPTLGDAISQKRRIFVFMRTKKDELNEPEFIRETQINHDEIPDKVPPKSATVLSTYVDSFFVGENCEETVKKVVEICRKLPQTDFTKLSLFGKYNFMECVSTTSKICNARLKDALDECSKDRMTINFLHLDYPNYPKYSEFNVVKVAHEYNLKKLTF